MAWQEYYTPCRQKKSKPSLMMPVICLLVMMAEAQARNQTQPHDPAHDPAQTSDCNFLLQQFQALEHQLNQVNLTAPGTGALAALQANIATLYEIRSCRSEALIASLRQASSSDSSTSTSFTQPVSDKLLDETTKLRPQAIPKKNREHSLIKQASDGDAQAQFELGNQMFLDQDDDSVKWWQKAATQNHPGALYNLGIAHINGTIKPSDTIKAVKLWRQAAALGHGKAALALERAASMLEPAEAKKLQINKEKNPD